KLQVAGVRQGYRRLRETADAGPIVEKINARFAEREERDVVRIQGILKFAVCEGCRVEYLLNYFGESRGGKCGHCDRCEGQPPGRLPVTHRHALGEPDATMLERLRGEGHRALGGPRQLA